MDETLRKLLDQLPDRAPRSKLEPHAEVIRELRKKRRTYQEIAAFFEAHLQLSVAPSTLHHFVKTRARQARNRTREVPELPAEQPREVAPIPASPPVQPSTAEPLPVAREHPAVTPKEQPLFEFDAEEPVVLQPKPGQK